MTLSRVLMLLLLPWHNAALGATFENVESYLSSFVGQEIANRLLAQSGEKVVGVVLWPCGEETQCTNLYKASVVVLARNQDGSLSEVVRSKAFQWQESAKTAALEAVEIENDKFKVVLAHFAPTGQTTFTFVHRKAGWVLAGRDSYFLRMNPEYGDEAVGDTMDKTSVNFLTGSIIETKYRGNKWHSERKCRIPQSRVALADVDLFDDELYAYCQ